MQNNSVQLDTYNNSWYKPGRNFFIRSIWYIINVLFFINPLFHSNKIKILLLRFFGAKIGKGLVIKPSVNIKYPWNLAIGNYSWIGEKVWIDNLGAVTIGSNCCISQGAMLLCGNHNFKSSAFDLMVADIDIQDGAWIGAKAIVCPGITCGSHSILSVNSVATKNLDPWGIYQGNPAIKVKQRIIEE